MHYELDRFCHECRISSFLSVNEVYIWQSFLSVIEVYIWRSNEKVDYSLVIKDDVNLQIILIKSRLHLGGICEAIAFIRYVTLCMVFRHR